MHLIKTNNYKKNWLIILAGATLFLGMIILLSLGNDFQYTGSRNFSNYPFHILIFSILFLAPVLEELCFRGAFVKNKKIKFTSFILLSIFILFQQKLFLIPLLIIFLLSFYGIKRKKNLFLNIAIFSNIALFAFAHYQISDFLKLETMFFVLFQISIGAICIWITLNFSLLKSILFHFTWNLTIVGFLLYSLQFPDTTLQTIENENYSIEWNKVPRFSDGKTLVEFSEDNLMAQNIEANKLYHLLDQENTATIYQYEPFVRYSIRVKLTGSPKKPEVKEVTKNFLRRELVFENP